MWKDQKWFFRDGQIEEAKRLVETHHYSRRFAGMLFIGTAHLEGGLFGDFGEAIAACCFGIPASRWSEPVVELQRLVLHPQYRGFPLSSLISQTVSYVKKTKKTSLLVSFADHQQGHHGGIYQACSWHYHGKRKERVDGFVIHGQFMPMKSVYNRFGTASQEKVEQILGISVIPHYDEGKHLYWKPLNTAGRHQAKRLELRSVPYPKMEICTP